MSIKFVFTADNSDVVAKLGEMQQQMASMSWADMVMGVQAVIGLLDQAKNAIAALMAPAAALEDMSVKLGVMLNDSAAGEALAASFERLATNGVVALDDLQGAAAGLVSVFDDSEAVERWVPVLADIAAGSRLSATQIAAVVAALKDTGRVELTEMAKGGVPIYEALAQVLGKTVAQVKQMQAEGALSVEALLAAFAKLTAEGEKFYNMNAAMSNTTAGSWETLKASWNEVLAAAGASFNDVVRPMLQRLSEFLQEHKEAFAAMLKTITRLAIVWTSIKVAGMVAGLMKCVAAIAKMVAAAKSLREVMASSGGLVTLINTLLGMALWKVGSAMFGGGEGEENEAEETAERAESAAERAEAAAEAEMQALTDATREQVEAKRREVMEVLRACDSVAKFEQELSRFEAEGNVGGVNVEHERKMVQIREEQQKAATQWEELQRREKNLKESEYDAHSKAKIAAFGGMDIQAQRAWLEAQLARWGVTGDLSTAGGMAEGVRGMQRRAAEAGMVHEWDKLANLLKYVEKYGESVEKYGAIVDEIKNARKREKYLLTGDKEGLERFDDAQKFEELRKGYRAAGMSEQEAAWYAGQEVAIARKLARMKESGEEGGQGVQVVASSSMRAGLGGTSIRLGDAQLAVSRKQLGTLEAIRGLVSSISTRATGIPVVL